MDFSYQIDPYKGCEHRCTYCYTQNTDQLDWEHQIGTYPEIEEKLAKELYSLSPQIIYMGMNTDPYQPVERKLKQTRKTLMLLKKQKFSVCILTKSDLIIRDIDILKTMNNTSAGISIAFQDKAVGKLFEPYAQSTEQRIEALKKLKSEDIKTYALICPVMPFLTDIEILMEQIAPHADTVWIYPLEIESKQSRNWQKIEQILNTHFSSIARTFQEIVFSKTHRYWKALREHLMFMANKHNIALEIHL